MILVIVLIGFALALGLTLKRVGLGSVVAIALFTCVASIVFLYAYFRL